MPDDVICFLAGAIMPAVSLGSCGLALSQIWKGHLRLTDSRQMLSAWVCLCILCGICTNLLQPLFPVVYSAVSVLLFLSAGLLLLNRGDRRTNRTVLSMRIAGELFCAACLFGIHCLDPAYGESAALMGLFAMGQVFNFMLLAVYVLRTLKKQGRGSYLWLLWIIVGSIVAVELILFGSYILLAMNRAPVPPRLVGVCYLAFLLLLLSAIVFFYQKNEYDRLLHVLRMREEARIQSEYESGLQHSQQEMESLRSRCLLAVEDSLDSLRSGSHKEALDRLKILHDAFRKEKPVTLTSVPALNAILAQKQADCQRQAVRLRTEFRFSSCQEEMALDLCIIAGNLLDNAIRAVSLLPQPQREILFSVQEIQHCLIIRTANRWDPAQADAIRQSGCGHRILGQLAQRYQGEFSASGNAQGMYEARIVLPVSGSASEGGGLA